MSKAQTPPSENPKAGVENVASILRDRIVKGELPPRARIVERQLSAELGVSRTPVREALKLLEADGLIEISLHRGAVVSEFRPEDAVTLFEVIAVLEGLAAKRVCEIITPDILQRLEDMHSAMLDHHKAGRRNGYFDLNTAIHDFIIQTSANPVLITTHQRLMIQARRGRYLAIMEPERLAQAVDEHEDLMRAFRSGQASKAAEIWETHLRHTGQTVAAVLQSGNAS
ncbi:Transcriptional regulator, GntR family [Candidatus Rhodobacter oscarellae]|uniref:Transcriptional regulator, GntR family n=1 Tax=Candidatus Rhodobacter oscarellae TaxID=1675527 RepID=A0A0J9E4G1_9RHOB|nr:GntR family transcriptional regulator [Candidatus Rhodobacter lobularis]KMW57665.1 Transcriptional regulator, GntR family [Candidatus Rhodobacter lobularis]